MNALDPDPDPAQSGSVRVDSSAQELTPEADRALNIDEEYEVGKVRRGQ